MKTTVVSAKKIVTMTGKILYDYLIIIRQGKIADLTAKEHFTDFTDCIYYDFSDYTIIPGLIDCHCHVGIEEEIYSNEGDDVNELSCPVTPELRAIDAVNPEDPAFSDAVAGGVTTVVVTPGSSNVIAGEMAALKTSGRYVDEMIVRAPIGMKAALGENPKKDYGKRDMMPVTRMGSAALLRESLTRACNYRRRQTDAVQSSDCDFKLEGLSSVLNREIPLRVHAHRADDIMTAVRIAKEFDVKLIIEHGTEGYKVAEQLAVRDIAVIVGPLLVNRAKVEMMNIGFNNIKILMEAGVKVAMMTDHPAVPVKYLSLQAAIAAREGIEELDALALLTCNAAQILGISDKIGSIEVGKDADLVVIDGSLFELRTKVQAVFINGRRVFGK